MLFCGWDIYLGAGMILVSILTYIAIAVERYLVIVHPMKFTNALGTAKSRSSGGGNKKLIVIGCIWLFTVVYELPHLRYRRVLVHDDHSNSSSPINNSSTGSNIYHQDEGAEDFSGHYICREDPKTTLFFAYEWSGVALTYFVPLAVSTVLYTRICRVLWASNAVHTRGMSMKLQYSIAVTVQTHGLRSH